jgi:hypothetical protein
MSPDMTSEYRQRRYQRELSRLLQRVLQLDEILCKDAVLDAERAAHIKAQIKRSQRKLDLVYDELDFLEAEGS